MTKLLIAISFLLFVGSPFANAEQVYYCVSELTTGIIKDEKTGKWKGTRFKKTRYTIKFDDFFTELTGLNEIANYTCKSAFYTMEDIRICDSQQQNGNFFQFNKTDLRFLYLITDVRGYLYDQKDSITNSMDAGTCQKF